MYFNKYNSYDKLDPKDFKKQVDAAYAYGMSGNETNPVTVAARATKAADVAALERTEKLLNYVSQTSDVHKRIRDHLIQDRKWLAHHDKCIDATKRGFEQLKTNAKVLVEEAFAAGELNAEKHLKLKLAEERANKQQNNNNNQQKQHNNNQNNQSNNNGKKKDKNKNKNKNKPVVLHVQHMSVKQLDDGKKKDKNKDDKKAKFFQFTPG